MVNFIQDAKSGDGKGFLVPKESKRGFNLSLFFRIFSIAVLIIAAASFLFLFLSIKSLNNKISSVKAQIDDYETARDINLETSILNLDQKIKLFSNLINNHLYFKKFVDWLKTEVAANVKFSNVKIEASGTDLKVSIEAASKSYADISRQLAIFSNSNVVKSYSLGQMSNSGNEIKFSVNLNISKEILK